MDKIVIGVASTRRDVFNAKEAARFKDIVLEKLHTYPDIEVVDINDINAEGLLFDDKDLDAVTSKFIHAKVDGVFFPHGNFGTEYLVAQAAKKIGKPVLLWGPRDDAPQPNGVRTRDTQCGLFATGKIFRRMGVPFTYITNCRVEDREFENGLKLFAAVCGVVRAFRKIKILQISTRPAPFWTMMVNEGELLERFGVQVFPISLTEMLMGMDKIIAENGGEYRETMDKVGRMKCDALAGTDGISKIAAMKVFIKRTAEEHGCTAVSLQCWTALQDAIALMPCVTNGLLTDEGLPTMCETDIHGAISSILLQEAVRRTSPIFFADLTVRHPVNDNAELLWHCGNFPSSLAKEPEKAEISCNFVLPSHAPGIGIWELKEGPITVCRFDGDNGEYKLFMGQGHAVAGPKTIGTYVWFEVPDWKKWEYKLVNGPYVHHVAATYGQVSAVLYEACKYIPGLTPDPAQPTKEEIEDYLIHL